MDNDNFKDEFDYEILNDISNDKYEIKGEPSKVLLERNDIDFIIKLKKDELESMRQIRKLESIKKAVADKDPKNIEDDYFRKYNCFTEKSKIELEAKYIQSKMINEKSKYSAYPNYDLDLSVVNHILKSIDKINPNDYKNIKQCLILIELDMRLDIAFFSELDNVYDLKKKKKEDNPDTYRRGF